MAPSGDHLGRDKDNYGHNDTNRQLQQSRFVTIEPESFSDSCGEGTDGACGDLGARGDHEHRPCQLIVQEELLNMGLLEFLVLDTGLVLSNMLDNGNFLVVVEEPRVCNVIRQVQESDDTKHHGDQADNQEHDLPGGEVLTVVMLEPEGDKTADHVTGTGLRCPVPDSGTLLRLGVVHTTDGDAANGGRGLEHTQQGSDHHQRGVSLTGAVAGENGAPQTDERAHDLRQREVLDQQGHDRLHEDIRSGEDRAQVAELVTLQVLLDPHRRRVVQQRLVQEHEQVRHTQETQDVQVQLPLDPAVQLRGSVEALVLAVGIVVVPVTVRDGLEVLCTGFLQELQSDIDLIVIHRRRRRRNNFRNTFRLQFLFVKHCSIVEK